MQENFMQPVESSNLAAVGYNQDNEQLFIEFKNGNVYVYDNVPFPVYTDLMDADSLGSYFHKYIRTSYEYRKL
jgi:hypothetical protein